MLPRGMLPDGGMSTAVASTAAAAAAAAAVAFSRGGGGAASLGARTRFVALALAGRAKGRLRPVVASPVSGEIMSFGGREVEGGLLRWVTGAGPEEWGGREASASLARTHPWPATLSLALSPIVCIQARSMSTTGAEPAEAASATPGGGSALPPFHLAIPVADIKEARDFYGR